MGRDTTMDNQKIILFLLGISIFLNPFVGRTRGYGLYWNTRAPLLLPFAGQGVQRVVLDIPLVTNLSPGFALTTQGLVIQPLGEQSLSGDGVIRLVYPWREVTYRVRLVTQVPVVDVVYTPQLGRGKSGLVIYTVKAEAPFQTWLVDNLGLRYYPVQRGGVWVSPVGWPLGSSVYHLKVVVQDAAGSHVEEVVRFSSVRVSYRVRSIPLASDFAQSQGKEVGLTNLKGDPLADYEALMQAFARQTKASIFDLTYRRPSAGVFFLTNLAFRPLEAYETSSLFGDERRFLVNGKTVRSSYHSGIDLVSPQNTPIVSSWGGRVVFADYNGAAGNTVLIHHGLGIYAVYMHLDRILVTQGEVVSPGQQIGFVGKTGYSTGAHLHLGISVQGRYVDPSDWTNQGWIEEALLRPLARYTHGAWQGGSSR